MINAIYGPPRFRGAFVVECLKLLRSDKALFLCFVQCQCLERKGIPVKLYRYSDYHVQHAFCSKHATITIKRIAFWCQYIKWGEKLTKKYCIYNWLKFKLYVWDNVTFNYLSESDIY
ncbi:unnamed protein product [Arctogadus glacialis]